MLTNIQEKVVSMGESCTLNGILSIPQKENQHLPIVLLFNSGIMHHVGTCGLSLKLARQLAASGFTCLRFDFSGIGDSEPRSDGLPFELSCSIEAIEVMDFLQENYKSEKFILYGLCSGADASYYTALKDDRVIGIVQVDPYCYPTIRYKYHYYLPKILDMHRWYSYLAKKIGLIKQRKKSGYEVAGIHSKFFEAPDYTRDFPNKSEVEKGIKQLLSKKINILNIYTGNDIYNYKDQVFDSLNISKQTKEIDVLHLSHASHILSEPEIQRSVVESIVAWIKKII